MQEAIAGPLRTGGNDSEIRMTVDEMHPPELVQLIFVRVLDDAQAVHPEVPEPKGVCDVDRVEDGLGKERGIYPDRVYGYVGNGGFVGLCTAPHVAECHVLAVLTLSRD